MKFKDIFLNEIHAKENNRDYFVIPTDATKNEYYNSLPKEVTGREILECINYFVKYHPDNFKLVNRQENAMALSMVGVPFKESTYKPFIFSEIIPYIEAKHFNKDKVERNSKQERQLINAKKKDDCYAYIFVIKNPQNVIPALKGFNFSQLYLKFDFLYSVEHENGKDRFISPGKNRYGDLVIKPESLYLTEISFHF